MADTTSDDVTDAPADVTKEVDTSTDEVTPEEDDGDLEDIEVTPEELGDDTKKDEEDSTDESEEVVSDGESPEETEEQSKESDSEVLSEADQKRQAFEARQAKRQEREAMQAQLVQEQTRYIESAETLEEERLRAIEVRNQNNEIEAYNNRIDRTTNSLISEWQQAANTIDVFKNPDPSTKLFLNDAIDEFQARYVTIDQNGNPINVKGSLYEHLNKKADILRAQRQSGVRQGNEDRAKTKGMAMTPPAKSPPTPKKDPDLEAFDEEASK